MAIPSGLQNSRVDSVAIVLHDDAQSTRGVIDIYFDLRRAGMAEGVYNRFAADPVHLVFQEGMQRAWHSVHNYAEPGVLVSGQLLLDD